MVGFVDAVLIAIALLIIGVPLVVPLAIVTFFAAFVPLIGAFIAGLLAVLIALVSAASSTRCSCSACRPRPAGRGPSPLPAADVARGDLHPAVIVVASAPAVLAGIIGVFLAVPVAGVVSVVLQYAQDRPPPETRSTSRLLPRPTVPQAGWTRSARTLSGTGCSGEKRMCPWRRRSPPGGP